MKKVLGVFDPFVIVLLATLGLASLFPLLGLALGHVPRSLPNSSTGCCS